MSFILDGITAEVWIDVGDFSSASVTVKDIVAGDAAELRGSDKKNKPQNSEDGVLVGSQIIADGRVEVVVIPRWIKPKFISNFGADIITMQITLRERK